MIVSVLKTKHALNDLLQAVQLARSVYYYQLQANAKPAAYVHETEMIESIYHEHRGRYGYRRIHLELKRQGIHLNHKTVQKLMVQRGLKSTVRPKKYRSYRCTEEGKTAPNVLERDFTATRPDEKWVTDVTEFKVKDQKVYLSPLIDLFTGEVISYRVAKNVRLPLVTEMLQDVIGTLKGGATPIVHSDQGWQYRHSSYQKKLADSGLIQSMSRRGNCLDNAVAENFFALLKTEMFHGQDFESADDLIEKIDEYITYYNTKRIKVKLKGLTPVEYRNQALQAA